MKRTEGNPEPVAASEEKCELPTFRRLLSPAFLTETWRKEYQNGHQSCRSYCSVCTASRRVPFSGDIFIGGNVLFDNRHEARDRENQLRTTLRTQVQSFELSYFPLRNPMNNWFSVHLRSRTSRVFSVAFVHPVQAHQFTKPEFCTSWALAYIVSNGITARLTWFAHLRLLITAISACSDSSANAQKKGEVVAIREVFRCIERGGL